MEIKAIDFRHITRAEIPLVAQMESTIFSDGWSEKSLTEAFDGATYKMIGAFDGEKLCGYVILIFTLDEAELARIATASGYRRCGIASHLMDYAYAECGKGKIAEIFLEVRSKNESAIKLYEKYGFMLCGKRKGYYSNPTDDAVLMKKTM